MNCLASKPRLELLEPRFGLRPFFRRHSVPPLLPFALAVPHQVSILVSLSSFQHCLLPRALLLVGLDHAVPGLGHFLR